MNVVPQRMNFVRWRSWIGKSRPLMWSSSLGRVAVVELLAGAAAFTASAALGHCCVGADIAEGRFRERAARRLRSGWGTRWVMCLYGLDVVEILPDSWVARTVVRSQGRGFKRPKVANPGDRIGLTDRTVGLLAPRNCCPGWGNRGSQTAGNFRRTHTASDACNGCSFRPNPDCARPGQTDPNCGIKRQRRRAVRFPCV